MQLANNPCENSLLLGLGLLLVAGARSRVGHSDLCRLLRVRQAQAGGQGNRGLKKTTQMGTSQIVVRSLACFCTSIQQKNLSPLRNKSDANSTFAYGMYLWKQGLLRLWKLLLGKKKQMSDYMHKNWVLQWNQSAFQITLKQRLVVKICLASQKQN